MLYRFDVEQLAAKDGKLLISRAGRHFLLGGLPQADLTQLVNAYTRADFIGIDGLRDATRQVLLDGQFIHEADPATLPAYKAEQRKRRQTAVYRVASAMRMFGGIPGLLGLLAASLAIYLLAPHRMAYVSIAELVATAPAVQTLLAILTLAFTTAIHELGHAAAACYYTGTVGKANFRLIWGIPAVTVDVTSFCLTGRGGKVAISVAGGVFQIFVSVCLLAASDVQGIQAGASMGVFLALFNLLPLPQYDGYWIIVDLIGRRVHPRIVAATHWMDVGYGLVLLGLFAEAMPPGVQAIFRQAVMSVSMFDSAPLRGGVLFVFSLFALASLAIFSVTLFRTLFGFNTPGTKL